MDHNRLEPLAPFAGLTDGERRMLAGVLDERSYETGEDIVKQGDYGYEFMVIEQGTVDVLYNGEKVDEMGPGRLLRRGRRDLGRRPTQRDDPGNLARNAAHAHLALHA